MLRLSRIVIASVVAIALTAPRTAAQVVVHTTLASYLAAISGPAIDTFDDLRVGSIASPLARTAGAYAYTVSTSAGGLYPSGTSTDRWMSADRATASLTFAGFNSNVRGVAGLFFGSDIDGLFAAGSRIVVTATDASGAVSRTIEDATLGSFLGFTSTSPFVSLVVSAVQPVNDFRWATVNDLRIGAAPVNVVPEPASLALLGVGLACLAGVRRKRG